MAHRPTVAELLKTAKKKRDKLAEKAVRDVEKLIPPIFGPGGKVAPTVVRGVIEVEKYIMDAILDKALLDNPAFANMEIPLGRAHTQSKPFDPDNPITRFLQDLEFPGRSPRVREPKKPRVRTDPQLVNDQIQSVALTAVNKMARKKDGSFKKGWSQKKVMRLAQKECTKERERLGLCERKSTRKGQKRKTARRAYER